MSETTADYGRLSARSPTQKRGMRTVAAIRAATGRLLSQDDVLGFTVADIAREAGVGIGTFYHYYPSKEALLLDVRGQLFAEGVAATAAAFGRGIRTPHDFLDGLRRLLRSWIDAAAAQRGLERALAALSYAHADVAAALRAQEAPARQLVAALLAQYGRVLRPCDPERTAEIVIVVIDAVVARAMRDPALAADPDGLVDEAVRMLGHHLLPDARLEPSAH